MKVSTVTTETVGLSDYRERPSSIHLKPKILTILADRLTGKFFPNGTRIRQFGQSLRSLNLELVNFCREDEVIFAETTDCMRPNLNRHIFVPDQMKVRMVCLCLCDLADAGKKVADLVAFSGRESPSVIT